jgi:hypothetical protein
MATKISKIGYAPNTITIISHNGNNFLGICNANGSYVNTIQPYHPSILTKSKKFKEVILSKLN